MTPLDFASSLMGYCYATGASVTSWGRTAQRNAQVGGHENSWHLVWMGADVAYDVKPSLAKARKAASRFRLIVVRESDHDHLQPPGGSRATSSGAVEA